MKQDDSTWHFDIHKVDKKERKYLEEALRDHPDNVLVIGMTDDGEFTKPVQGGQND